MQALIAICIIVFAVWYFYNPYRLKQKILIFDVTGKRHRTLHIDTYIDDYIRDGTNWALIEANENARNRTLGDKRNKLARVHVFRKHRSKQFENGTNGSDAYLFQLRRFRRGEPLGSIDAQWATSYEWLSKRRDMLADINYATNLRSWNAKNQRELMTPELRMQIMERDNYTCQICGKYMPDGNDIHIDHIIPIARGGKTVPDNLQVLCSHCNLSKGTKMPDEYMRYATGKWNPFR